MNIPLLLLVLVITAALWFLYHKIFDVYYFDSVAGIAKELMVCFVLSFIVLAILYQSIKNPSFSSTFFS